MLVDKYFLKDIKRFEELRRTSILDVLRNLSISSILILIQLGNRNCNEEKAAEMLDAYLLADENNTLLTALKEIRFVMFGEDSEDNKDGSIDISSFKNLTEVYTKMCFELMSIGISYSEFWQFSTTDMYDAFEACSIKQENDINNALSLGYSQAGLIAAAVWGKLPKEVPHVTLADKPETTTYVEGYGELTASELRDVMKMKAQVAVTGGS